LSFKGRRRDMTLSQAIEGLKKINDKTHETNWYVGVTLDEGEQVKISMHCSACSDIPGREIYNLITGEKTDNSELIKAARFILNELEGRQ
jgi:hypothetical protein